MTQEKTEEKPKANILERFRELCDNATDKELESLWIILSAVRGPDNENYTVKSWWTCLVRENISMRLFRGSLTNNQPKPLPRVYEGESVEDFADRITGRMHRQSTLKVQEHYARHVALAIYEIQTINNNKKEPTQNE